MPILFACIVNKQKTFVVSCLGTKTQGDFANQVLKK